MIFLKKENILNYSHIQPDNSAPNILSLKRKKQKNLIDLENKQIGKRIINQLFLNISL